jgi:predicted nucleic acid-binding protein
MADTVLVDAHIILRFFPGEPPEQAAAAERLCVPAGQGAWRTVVPPLVVAEVLDVATSPHGLGLARPQAVRDGRDVGQLPGIDGPARARLLDALRRFETTNGDGVDCVWLSYAADPPAGRPRIIERGTQHAARNPA